MCFFGSVKCGRLTQITRLCEEMFMMDKEKQTREETSSVPVPLRMEHTHTEADLTSAALH